MANRVLVCVTKQKTCERLIKTGARLAKEAGDAELLVVHVLHRDDNILGNMMQGLSLIHILPADAPQRPFQRA